LTIPLTGDEGVRAVREWVGAAGRITALTGAGISTDSGLPDFRGPRGLWTLDPSGVRLSSLAAYLAEPDLRRRLWASLLEQPVGRIEPNDGHRALAELGRSRSVTVVTQNVDGLHQLAGSDPARVIELHGSMRHVQCLSCGTRSGLGAVLERVSRGDADPSCERCGGVLKPATVAFGQPVREPVLRAALAAARECDVFLAIGTTLSVSPAVSVAAEAARHAARLVIANGQPTTYDRFADALLRGSITAVLRSVLSGPPGTGHGS
jgi:NAD-dependent deacetylase